MISRLRGKLLELHESIAVIDVGGVGYEAEITTTAAAALAAGSDGDVELFTHLSSRDDGQFLYGFATSAERDNTCVRIVCPAELPAPWITGSVPRRSLGLSANEPVGGFWNVHPRAHDAPLSRWSRVDSKA